MTEEQYTRMGLMMQQQESHETWFVIKWLLIIGIFVAGIYQIIMWLLPLF